MDIVQSLCFFVGIPSSNLYDWEEYEKILCQAGFGGGVGGGGGRHHNPNDDTSIPMMDLSGDVWPGFAKFLDDHYMSFRGLNISIFEWARYWGAAALLRYLARTKFCRFIVYRALKK